MVTNSSPCRLIGASSSLSQCSMPGPAAPDAADRPGRPDVLEWVAADEHQVGPAPRFDHSPVVQPEVAGGQIWRGPQRVGRAQPGPPEKLQLVVQAVTRAGGGRGVR